MMSNWQLRESAKNSHGVSISRATAMKARLVRAELAEFVLGELTARFGDNVLAFDLLIDHGEIGGREAGVRLISTSGQGPSSQRA
jgi:hypothetical protein